MTRRENGFVLKPSSHRYETDDLRVAVLPAKQLLILRAYPLIASLTTALEQALDCIWPPEANCVSYGVCDVFWLSPNEWLLAGGPDNLGATIDAVCAGNLYHLSDVTDGRIAFRIEGPASQVLLSKGCSLDFHDRSFAIGRCAQTLLAQIPILVHRPSEQPAFELYVDASFGTYLKSWFADACVPSPESK